MKNKANKNQDIDDYEALQIILNENPTLKRRVLHRIKEIRQEHGFEESRDRNKIKEDRQQTKK